MLSLDVQGAWLAQSVEHATPDLGFVEFKPYVGHGTYFKKKKSECAHIKDMVNLLARLMEEELLVST